MPTVRDQLESLISANLEKARTREREAFDSQTEGFEKSLVVYGAGKLGRKAVAGLRKMGIEPLAIADGNPALSGKQVDGVTVYSPADAASKFGKIAAFIICIWSPGPGRRYHDIYKTLHRLGCLRIVSFVPLFWKRPDLFLPHYRIDLPSRLIENAPAIRTVYDAFADEASRAEFVIQLRWMTTIEFGPLLDDVTPPETYFPERIFTLGQEETFVDCGAYDGDTLDKFLQLSKNQFREYFCFEPDPANFVKLERYVAGLPAEVRSKIHVDPWAVGARRETVRFEANADVSSAVSATGEVAVECHRLDEVLQGSAPTQIKMDIEGFEPDALAGAEQTIRRHAPILSICVYHRQEHLWEIPLQIQSFGQDYAYYQRRYVDEFGDQVFYAVPRGRIVG